MSNLKKDIFDMLDKVKSAYKKGEKPKRFVFNGDMYVYDEKIGKYKKLTQK